jgi:ABC-type transporter Mla maintaining outer membrane lipid asymmetry ATPase subunit MlaF
VSAVLELTDVSKNYQGLRPLRIAQLTVAAGEQVAVLGLDQMAAEVLVHLITGATLPDRGDVKVFGRSTQSIADGAEWLALVDRFGIVSDRAVLLEPLSVVQNLAVPFTLDIEPPPADVRRQAEALAIEVGLPRETWDRAIAELDGGRRTRVRLGRALALDPAVLVVEHATAGVAREDVVRLGADIGAIARQRGVAIIAATADMECANAIGGRVLTLDAATGRLRAPSVRTWLRSRLG